MLSLGSEKIGGATTSSPITTADPSPPALWRTTRPQVQLGTQLNSFSFIASINQIIRVLYPFL